MGIAYTGWRWNDHAARMNFIRFSGELFIYYVLMALGLTIIFGLLDVINMSHGEFYALGAFVALALSSIGLPFWLLLLLVPLVMLPVGYIVERGLIPAGQQQKTVIAQVANAVFGSFQFGFLYVSFSTALILALAANTATMHCAAPSTTIKNHPSGWLKYCWLNHPCWRLPSWDYQD